MTKYEELKEKIVQGISANLKEAIALNDNLADNPEVSGQEYETSRKIVELMQSKGFKTEHPFAGMDNAFRGIYGENNHKYKVALMVEFDALPGIGHACGHCVSGSISVLAGLAMAQLQDELNTDIHIVGTPAEETTGGKCLMVDQGVFDEYDMAMMIHLYDQNLLYCKCLAIECYRYEFRGKAAHASAAPWEGVNALNGAQLMFHGVDMLRQHVTPDVRMHGVYKDAGLAPGIVPEFASAEFFIRSLNKDYLKSVVDKVADCAKGAAMATQTTVDIITTDHPFADVKMNEAGVEVLREVYEELGVPINGNHDEIFGSSDAGNVSYACPTFHPTLQLVDRGVAIHTREFESAVKTDKAHECIETGAKIIALQTAKIFSDEAKIAAMKADFEKN